MQCMPLEVRHMRHVIALAEHGSFARAATALGLSQSALSRSIQSVEREIGSSLFVRTASGVDPTDGGHVFIARVRQIAQLTDDLDRDLVNERGLQSGHLHVGGGPFPAQSMLADALARFVADYPRIVVRMMMRGAPELSHAIQCDPMRGTRSPRATKSATSSAVARFRPDSTRERVLPPEDPATSLARGRPGLGLWTVD